MPAVAADLHDVLVCSVAAVIAAVRGVAFGTAAAYFMSAFSFVSHFDSSDDFENARIRK
jgi:hypothetical protein